jgi:hypothetical protein
MAVNLYLNIFFLLFMVVIHILIRLNNVLILG